MILCDSVVILDCLDYTHNGAAKTRMPMNETILGLESNKGFWLDFRVCSFLNNFLPIKGILFYRIDVVATILPAFLAALAQLPT